MQKPKFELLNSGRALNQHEEQYIQDLKSQCTILVMDTTLEDHGTWTCKAKDDAFARDDHAETSIEKFVFTAGFDIVGGTTYIIFVRDCGCALLEFLPS